MLVNMVNCMLKAHKQNKTQKQYEQAKAIKPADIYQW